MNLYITEWNPTVRGPRRECQQRIANEKGAADTGTRLQAAGTGVARQTLDTPVSLPTVAAMNPAIASYPVRTNLIPCECSHSINSGTSPPGCQNS